MAVSPEDLLSTPAAYATPGQLADARKYADLMTKSSTSSGKITSPYQGYAKIVQGLMGGLEENEADRQEAMGRAASMLTSSQAMTGQAGALGLGQQRMPGGGAALPTGLPGEGGRSTPTSQEHVDLSAGNYPVPMEAAKAAIAENESGGRYGEIGPMVLRGSYAGDRAYGKYQVMGKDLSDRLAKAGLPQMSASQFLMNPRAQELQFEHEFGGLMQKYGTFNDAASMWFSGHPMRANDNSSDGWITTPGYIAKANRTLRQWQQQNQRASPGQTVSDAGPIGGPGARLAENQANPPYPIRPGDLPSHTDMLNPLTDTGPGMPPSQALYPPGFKSPMDMGPPTPPTPQLSPSERIAASMGPPPPTPNARIAASMGPPGGPSPSERVAAVQGPRPPVLSPSQIVDMAHAQHAPMIPGLTQVPPGPGTVPGATMEQPPMPAVPQTMPPVQPMVGGPAPAAAPPAAPPAPPSPPVAPPAPPVQPTAVVRPALPGAPLPDPMTPGPAVRPQIGGPGVPGQAVTPDGRVIPPPQFRPSPPARVSPAPPAQPAAPANAGTAPGFAPRTAPDQMHDPVSGHRYPVDPRDVYPHGAQLAALNAEWQNPWTPPDRLARIAEIFASKEFEDSNGRKWLYSPYNHPVLAKDSPGIKAEMKVGDKTLPIYINQGDDGVLRVINPLDQSSGGGPPAGRVAAGEGGGTSASAANPIPQQPGETPQPGAIEPVHTGLGPTIDRLTEGGIQEKARGDLLAKQNEALVKRSETKYDNITSLSTRAQEGLIDNELGKRIVNDPNFGAGFGHQMGDTLRGLASKFVGKDYQSVNDLFDKVRSKAALGEITDFTNSGKVGPVRIPEMRLVESATPNRDQMPGAIKALLEIRGRLFQRAIDVEQQAVAWRQTHHGLLGDDWDQHLQRFTQQNPIFTLEEYDHYTDLFKGMQSGPKGPLSDADFQEGRGHIKAHPDKRDAIIQRMREHGATDEQLKGL